MTFATPPWILDGPTRGVKVLTDYYTIRNEQHPIAYLHTDMFSPDGTVDRANGRLLVSAPRLASLLAGCLMELRSPPIEREIVLLLKYIYEEEGGPSCSPLM